MACSSEGGGVSEMCPIARKSVKINILFMRHSGWQVEISSRGIKRRKNFLSFFLSRTYSLMTNPRGEKTAVQMQDDPLSEFSWSVHLRSDGSLKPQRRERGFHSLKVPNCMSRKRKFNYLSLSPWMSQNALISRKEEGEEKKISEEKACFCWGNPAVGAAPPPLQSSLLIGNCKEWEEKRQRDKFI